MKKRVMLRSLLLSLCCISLVIICGYTYQSRWLVVQHQDRLVYHIRDIIQDAVNANNLPNPIDSIRALSLARGKLMSVQQLYTGGSAAIASLSGLNIDQISIMLQEQECSVLDYVRDNYIQTTVAGN